MNKTVICKDVFGNEYEELVENLGFRVGVYAIVIENNKILLSRQWDGYGIIGGTVEMGETLEEALIREIKEETGLTIVPNKIIYHATTFFKRNEKTNARQSVQLYFNHKEIYGEISNSMITGSEKEYTNDIPEWVDLDQLESIKFRHSVDLDILINAFFDENRKS